MSSELTRLRVAKGVRSDAGKGFARIHNLTMKKLNISTGDIITVQAKKLTGAIVIPARPEDDDETMIRMNGLLRTNSGASIGEYVNIEKVEVEVAEAVVIAPVEKGIKIRATEEQIRSTIISKVVTEGDLLSLSAPSVKVQKDSSEISEIPFLSHLFGSGTSISMSEVRTVVINTTPSKVVQIGEHTRITVSESPMEFKVGTFVTYEDIGGLDEPIRRVREMVELPLKHPEVFERLGIEPPKGVLLYGPPGTGKTLLAKAVAKEANATFHSVAGPEIMSKFYGESERKLRDIFDEAERTAPSIIFFDEVDSLAPKREEVTGEVERRVVAQLLSAMDGMKSRGRVVVIAATNRINAIDPALRRPGRFDREIELAVPDKDGRTEILSIHMRGMPIAESVVLSDLINRTNGFVGADLASLCREAAMQTLRRILPEIDLDSNDQTDSVLFNLRFLPEDFDGALRYVYPSALREVMIQIPNVKWSEIGGLKQLKASLIEMVELPLTHPEVFTYHGIRPPRGILLFGAPGTGKTMLAKAVATESQANFISIRGPEILSKWVGESERAIREVFRKARQAAPSIVFFDEIDAISPKRGGYSGSTHLETIVNQLLTELDGLEELKGVVVIAATNRPDMVDPALLRAGRFDRLLLVPAPDAETRLEILSVHMKNMHLADDLNIHDLVERTVNFAGSDLENLCREAVMIALREEISIKEVSQRHFGEALKLVRPSLNSDIIKYYQEMADKLLQKMSSSATIADDFK